MHCGRFGFHLGRFGAFPDVTLVWSRILSPLGNDVLPQPDQDLALVP